MGNGGFQSFQELAPHKSEIHFHVFEPDFLATGAFTHVSLEMCQIPLLRVIEHDPVSNASGYGNHHPRANGNVQKDSLWDGHIVANKGNLTVKVVPLPSTLLH